MNLRLVHACLIMLSALLAVVFSVLRIVIAASSSARWASTFASAVGFRT